MAELGGGEQLRLLKCRGEFSLQFRGEELMGTRDYLTEEALATMTAARLRTRDGPVLVGGLGMGYTLGATLRAWHADAPILVCELLPEIIEWAKGPLAHILGDKLADPRVILERADIHDVIARSNSHFDAILLDVDNGPDGFLQLENDRLYCNWGLRSAYDALRPGGILAVWSAYPDAAFMDRLEAAGFQVEEVVLPAWQDSETDSHMLWFAAKPWRYATPAPDLAITAPAV